MKKFGFSVTLFVLAALILSACTAAPAAAPTASTGNQTGTPAAGATTGTGTPAAGANGTATAQAPGTPVSPGTLTPIAPNAGAQTGTPATSGGTSGTTSQATGTPAAGTTAGTATGTASASSAGTSNGTSGTSATDTPAAATGVTPIPQTTPILTGTPVAATTPSTSTSATGTPAASSNTGTGTGTGVTANPSNMVRLSVLMNSSVNSKDNSLIGKVDGVMVEQPNVNVQSNSGAATATPVVSASSNGLFVRYVVVATALGPTPTTASGTSSSTTSTTNDVLIPWQAFAFNGSVNNAGSVALTVNGSVVAAAPHYQLSQLSNGQVGAASQDSTYWAGTGMNIPATGSSSTQTNNMLFIPSSFNGMNITDAKNSVLGPVSDFLVDPATGQVMYALLNGGQTFNNRTFLVPMSALNLSVNGSAVSSFVLNIPSNLLNSAPFINSLNQLPINPTLIQQLNNFWNNIQSTPTK